MTKNRKLIMLSGISLALFCYVSATYANNVPLVQSGNRYIQGQQRIKSAENDLTKTIEQSAYLQTKAQEFPLSTNQIKSVRQTYQQTQKANYGPLYKVKQMQRTVNLDIASPKIETVNLVPNYGTIVSFFDASGSPWTIKKVYLNKDLGMTENIAGPKENQLIISTTNTYAQGTLIVTLMGLDNAVSINLNANTKLSDRRISFTLSQLSPKSLSKVIPDTPNNSSKETLMLNLLAGTVPNYAEPMKILGNIEGQAWIVGQDLYIRTQAQLVSPAWTSQKSAAGITLYQVPVGDTQFIFSANGMTEQVSIRPMSSRDGESE